MLKKWYFGSIVLVVALAALVGCENKTDQTAPKSNTDPAPGGPGTDPNANTPTDPQARVKLGETKYTLTTTDFVSEYTKSAYAANAKYADAVVELTGNAVELARVEVDSDGVPLGKSGARKATFVFGEPEAKRVETVVVRGLDVSAVGEVLRGEWVTVKGRVANYKAVQPVELHNAEVVTPGGAGAVRVTVAQLDSGPQENFALVERSKGKTVVFSGTAGEKTSDAGIDYVEIINEGRKVKCALSPGIWATFSSGLAKGKPVTLAGTLKLRKEEIKWWIDVRDAVPVKMPPNAG